VQLLPGADSDPDSVCDGHPNCNSKQWGDGKPVRDHNLHGDADRNPNCNGDRNRDARRVHHR
jgi:hypothetical protein